MKKVISFLIVISFILTGVCFAETGKTGFIDMKDILLNSDAGKAATLDLKKFIEEKGTQIKERENVLKNLKDDLEKQRPVLTESAYKGKELSYQKEYRDYKRFIEDTNGEMKLKDQELSRKLIPEILKIINTIGKREGYTSIMDIGSGGLVYYSKANDMTKQVIEEYNKAYNSKK
ncbi:MAG: OmpH family outer membrane protein [Deltaproteobacteria bacterium]|nr:OmpH family outer membrane protein [Deltaproteobacteria bacterium]